MVVVVLAEWVAEEGWHFSCERGCTRDDCGKAGPFSVARLHMDLPFVNVFVCTQGSASRPLGGVTSPTASSPPSSFSD